MASTTLDPATPEGARAQARWTHSLLLVLIARAGGEVSLTRQEFEEVAARYGGAKEMGVLFEEQPDGSVRAALVRSPARQGDLPA